MKIIIKLSNAGGELDRKVLEDFDPDAASKITDAVVEFIDGGILLPGDTITIREEYD